MAMIMVFTCVPMGAFAVERDTSSLDAYLDNENLAAVVETLLTDLNDRKQELVPTVLNFVFEFVDALKGKVDVKATTEEKAKALIEYADAELKKAELDKTIPAGVFAVFGVRNPDLKSVDGVLKILVGAGTFINKQSGWKDAAALDFTPLMRDAKKAVALQTTDKSKTPCTDIVYGLFSFLSAPKNVAVIKKAVMGKLDLGGLNATIKGFADMDVQKTVNDMMGNLDVMIYELIYDNLLQQKDKDGNAVKYADSVYKDFTADQLLAAALIKAISGEEVSLADAKKTAGMTFYQLIGTYADKALGKFAIDFLNKDLKKMLGDLVAKASEEQANAIKGVINLDYEFKVSDFNFSDMAQEGLFENLNNFVCNIIKVITTADAYTKLNLKTGGNENITANLTSFFGYVLQQLASYNGGKLEFTIDGKAYSYDFSQFTEDKIKDKSLEDMVVAVLRMFYVDWFGAEAPAEATTLEKLGGYTAYIAIDKFMVNNDKENFNMDYKSLVYGADGKLKNMSQADWFNAIGTMGMDVAVYWLNKATNFGMTVEKVQELKAKDGWTWEDVLEDIIDWALGYIKGVPAVADELSIERGKKDGYGAWYKLNVVLNELFPLAFVNGSGDATFTVDTYKFVMEKAAPSIFDCDFKAFADILATNDDAENPFNKPFIQATIEMVDNLLFAIFEHNCGKTANFTKEATGTRVGYKGQYCTANGHYVGDATVIPATGEEPTTKPEDPTTKPEDPTTKPEDPTTKPEDPPVGDYVKGDADGNGKVTATDARLTLRMSARLEPAPEAGSVAFLRIDVDGNGKITATDARKILRVSTRLEKFE